jgi:hydrogenase maturation protease
MPSLLSYLQERFSGVFRLAILGAGSMLKADDAAGCLVVENLKAAIGSHPNVLLCIGETAPENYSGKICAFKPSHLLLLDAADVGAAPGEIVEINPEDVGGPTFCSHMLPLKIMVNYIVNETRADAVLLGMQYETIKFDGRMSQKMEKAVQTLSDALLELIETQISR